MQDTTGVTIEAVSTIRKTPRVLESLRPIWLVVEKGVSTWLQAAAALLMASGFFETLDIDLLGAAAWASVPAGLTVLLNAVGAATIPTTAPYPLQVALRTLRTGAAAFLGVLVAVPMFEPSMSLLQAAAVAAGAAVLAAVKAELGRFIGDGATVAWVPESIDRGATDEIPGYSPNDDDPDGPTEPGDVPDWLDAYFEGELRNRYGLSPVDDVDVLADTLADADADSEG